MEGLSTVLQPYKGLVSTLASYVTMAQFFSGAFICNDIRKKGSTKNISSMPFIGGIVVGLAFLRYGIILRDYPMLQVNVFAIVLNLIYIIFYYFYSNDKWSEIFKPLSIGILLISVLFGYCNWEDKTLIEFRYGLIVTIMMLSLLGSPLLSVKRIIEIQDASEIPFVLTFMGTIVTFLWLLYGIILLNNFMIVQNVIGFVLCFTQLMLIFIYPAKSDKDTKSKNKKKSVKKD